MYCPRQLTPTLRRALTAFPAVLVTGPRLSGKTTFLRHEMGERAAYVSFDDPLERDFALQDPHGFLDRFAQRPVILDEIQYVPGLLRYIKMRIDASSESCGRWLLTGSQRFGLMRDVGESLAGRVAILELPPFSMLELPRDDLEAILWYGGYPVPALYPERRELWLRSYVATYLERDVRQMRNIPDLRSFGQFLGLAAARHGQVFHAAELAREQGISQPTVKSWSGVLEASYLALFLSSWFRHYGKRVIKSAKFYFFDPALVCYLTRQPDAGAALAGPQAGALFEGWVVSEAAKAFMAVGRKPDLYFWRSHDGLEVDLLVVAGGRLLPVGIKLMSTPVAGHLNALNRFIALAHDEAAPSGWLVCRAAKVQELPNGHLAIPRQQFPTRLAALLGQ